MYFCTVFWGRFFGIFFLILFSPGAFFCQRTWLFVLFRLRMLGNLLEHRKFGIKSCQRYFWNIVLCDLLCVIWWFLMYVLARCKALSVFSKSIFWGPLRVAFPNELSVFPSDLEIFHILVFVEFFVNSSHCSDLIDIIEYFQHWCVFFVEAHGIVQM